MARGEPGQLPRAAAGTAVEETFVFVLESLKARLMVQVGAAMFGDASYNVWAGDFEGSLAISQNYIDALEDAAPAPGQALEAYWHEVAKFIAVWSVTQAQSPLYNLMTYTSSLVARTGAYG